MEIQWSRTLRLTLSFFLFFLMAVLFGARPLFAEPYIGAFLGATVTPLSVDIAETGPGVNIQANGAKVDSSVAGGLKLGYWFDQLPSLGFETSWDFYSADVPSQTVGGLTLNPTDVSIFAWGFTLMARVPLGVSPQYPRGQLQPYVGLGPALFVAAGERGGGKSTDTVIGLQVLGGLKTFLSPHLAIFVEYKFNAFTPEFDVVGGLKDKFDYQIGAIAMGLAFHF